MTFLTKGTWLSLWQTQDVSLLGSGLTTLKSYNIGNHVKFIDSVKYYQQPLSKLARSTTSEERERTGCLFLEYLGFQHPCYRIMSASTLSGIIERITHELKKPCYTLPLKKVSYVYWSYTFSNNTGGVESYQGTCLLNFRTRTVQKRLHFR